MKLDKLKLISKAIDESSLSLAMLVLNGSEKKSKMHQLAYKIGNLMEIRAKLLGGK